MGARIFGRRWLAWLRAGRHRGGWREGQHRVRPRWHRWAPRWLRRSVLVSGVLVLASAAGGGVYVQSVRLPDAPVRPQASTLYYSDGRTVLARVGVQDRTNVRLADIPLPVRHAVLAAEDRTFYQHGPVSVKGILRSVWADLSQGAAEGASTITQQYVRNDYLTLERSVSRKSREMALSIKVEQRYSKDQILERYLNTIYFGRNAYGIQAAAVAYFGVPVSRLDAAQGAVLAAVIKDPTNFDPAINPRLAHQRWAWVMRAMADQRWVPAAARHARYPGTVRPSDRPSISPGPTGPIVEQVEHELAGVGVSAQELRTGGLSVVTTIDRRAQPAAEQAIRRRLAGQPNYLRAALVAVEPASGAVRAYYGGDQGPGFFDDAMAARRPAGAFAPFVLAAALDSGLTLKSTVDGTSPRVFPDRDGAALSNENHVQCPDCPIGDAVRRSLNTPTYALAEQVGPARVAAFAHAAGISDEYDQVRSLQDGPKDPRPGLTRGAIALGTYPVSTADLATRPVYSPIAAQQVSTALEPVAAQLAPLAPARPAAGKPGTQQWGDSSDNQAAWMAGYTNQLATVVWLGRDDAGPIRDAAGHPMAGETTAAALWADFLNGALAGQPVRPLSAGMVLRADGRGGSQPLEPLPGATVG